MEEYGCFQNIVGKSFGLKNETRLLILLLFWELCHHSDSSRLLWIWPVRERPSRQSALNKNNSGILFSTYKIGKNNLKIIPSITETISPHC